MSIVPRFTFPPEPTPPPPPVPAELFAPGVYALVPGFAYRDDAFALSVNGTCMQPMYDHGDTIVCWPLANHAEAEQGHPCAVLLHNGMHLLKLVYHEPGHPGMLVLRC